MCARAIAARKRHGSPLRIVRSAWNDSGSKNKKERRASSPHDS